MHVDGRHFKLLKISVVADERAFILFTSLASSCVVLSHGCSTRILN